MTICSAGEALKEYVEFDEQKENEFAITKYVEATAKELSVRIAVESNFDVQHDCVAFVITIDGIKIPSPVVRREVLQGRDRTIVIKLSEHLESSGKLLSCSGCWR